MAIASKSPDAKQINPAEIEPLKSCMSSIPRMMPTGVIRAINTMDSHQHSFVTLGIIKDPNEKAAKPLCAKIAMTVGPKDPIPSAAPAAVPATSECTHKPNKP